MTGSYAIAVRLPRRAAPYHGQVQSQSDEALARLAAGGDSAAFEQLVVRHQDRLYTLALRVTGSDADARDCVQEALISAWRAMHRFRGDARFSTWMYRIVLRKAYDAIDRRKRLPQPVDEVRTESRPGDPSDRIDLLAALHQLDLEFRTVAVACDVLGLSMEEAGDLLDLPAGTVKSRLHRARARLAEQLGTRTPS